MTKTVDVTENKPKEGDSVSYINIWTEGETELGRMLHQFYYSPFKHPYFGNFNSMEGFYHYVGTCDSVEKRDKLRSKSGSKAKEYAKDLTRGHFKEFLKVIFNANFYKIEQNSKMKELLILSTLPFEHYYLFGPGNIVICPKQRERVIKDFEELRKMFKEGCRPVEIDYSKYPELLISK